MSESKQNSAQWKGTLDTLANGGTHSSDKYYTEPLHKLIGKGTSEASMKKRPIKKFLDQKIMGALMDVSKENGDDEMYKGYKNTWYCFNDIKTDGERAYGNYCKNRWCSVCSGNRKALLINQYKPIIDKWDKPYFLTLTRQSVSKHKLKSTIKDNDIKFGRIKDRLNKRHKRGKGPKVIALRSTECNYNPVDQTYNPHYHIIVPNREIGRLLNIEWLREQNKGEDIKIARASGQHLIKIKDKEQNLIEVIKYGVKVITDPEMKKGKARTKLPIIYAAALHEIHKAFKGKKLLNKYGFELTTVPIETIQRDIPDSQIKSWSYVSKSINYIEIDTAEVMYKNKHLPNAELQYIANERVNKHQT